jgi:TolB protein
MSDRDGDEEIFIMDADGSNQVQKTSNLVEDDDPNWSPDGRFIAYTSEFDGSEDIWVMVASTGWRLKATFRNGYKDDEANWRE